MFDKNKNSSSSEPDLDKFKYQYAVSYKDNQSCGDTTIYSNNEVDESEAKQILIDQLNASNIEPTWLIVTKLAQTK